MKSLPTYGKTADCRRPKVPNGGLRLAAGRILIALVSVLSVTICMGPEIARGQSTGSACLAAPTLAMAGTRIINVATEAQLQSAMGNLQAGDTIVLANGTYNLTRTLYVNGDDNITIRGNSGCDQVVLVGRGMDNANYGSVPHGIWGNSRNTVIAHRKAGSDGQIIVWDSPATKVYHNTILTNGNVIRSIEFRFSTTGAEAKNNLADAPIGTRDGATFTQSGNLVTATSSLFVNPSAGDLHLKSTATLVIDQASALPSVTDDIDGNPRPNTALLESL